MPSNWPNTADYRVFAMKPGLMLLSTGHLLSYGEPDIFDLAAAYAFGLAKGHAFVDGNKRTSFVATELFLMLNGHDLRASDADCVMTWLALADAR